tara:strand:+ start:9 stop:2747 length:2739 start_codon:yes stop_codon:yes gene_type:complete
MNFSYSQLLDDCMDDLFNNGSYSFWDALTLCNNCATEGIYSACMDACEDGSDSVCEFIEDWTGQCWTGIIWSSLDCAGNCNGGAELDVCGVCNGDNTTCESGLQTLCLELNNWNVCIDACEAGYSWACNHVEENSLNDDCWTGSEWGFFDCAGNCNGGAELDVCGVCNGDNTTCESGLQILCQSLDNVDMCMSACEAGYDWGCYHYIQLMDDLVPGICFNWQEWEVQLLDVLGWCCDPSTFDDCGECNGPGSSEYWFDSDSDGLGFGDSWPYCHFSVEEGWVGNNDDLEPNCTTNDTDDCGVCAGGNANKDCNGDCCGGTPNDVAGCGAILDDCGECSGGNSGYTFNSSDLGCGCNLLEPGIYCEDLDADGIGSYPPTYYCSELGNSTNNTNTEIVPNDNWILNSCNDPEPWCYNESSTDLNIDDCGICGGDGSDCANDDFNDDLGCGPGNDICFDISNINGTAGTLDITYKSNVPVSGFQLEFGLDLDFSDISSMNNIFHDSDGNVISSLDEALNLQLGNNIVIGYFDTNSFLPAGEGTLLSLIFEPSSDMQIVHLSESIVGYSGGIEYNSSSLMPGECSDPQWNTVDECLGYDYENCNNHSCGICYYNHSFDNDYLGCIEAYMEENNFSSSDIYDCYSPGCIYMQWRSLSALNTWVGPGFALIHPCANFDCEGVCGGSASFDLCGLCNPPATQMICGCCPTYDFYSEISSEYYPNPHLLEGNCEDGSACIPHAEGLWTPALLFGYCSGSGHICEPQLHIDECTFDEGNSWLLTSESWGNSWEWPDQICDGGCLIDDCSYDCTSWQEENVDECGICGGPGAVYDCGCSDDIPSGACDCDGNVEDCSGECGGDANLGDLNQDGAINIIDAVALVNTILGISEELYVCTDYNQDGYSDVIDVIAIVNSVLYGD